MDQPLSAIERHQLRVVELFNEHNSMLVVAELLGLSKGAVAGIIFRARHNRDHICHSIIRPKLRHGAKEAQPKIHKRKANPRFERMINLRGSAPEPRIRLRLVESDTEVTFEQMLKHHCQYGIGDPRHSDFRFCGKQRRDEKTPYCVEHCAVCYLPPSRR